MCYGPRIAATAITSGRLPIADYENNPKCIMLWGNNLVLTNPDEYVGENFSRVLAGGAKLIVIDPRLTYLAGRADIWLQLRPGTDTALALGMANVIINEELYDKKFVQKYVHGWDKFVKRAQEYSLDKVEQITWVPAEQIREAARLYATTSPASIQWGVAIEQTINCIDNNRILTDLMAITGNLDIPGGNVFCVPAPIVPIGHYGMHRELPPEQRKKRLGGDIYKLANYIAVLTPKAVWDAIFTDKPYPIKAMLLHGTNPVMTRANANEVYRALTKVDFLVVSDFFMTPTAELADIVLPAATWLEFDDIGDYLFRHGYAFAREKAVQVGECRSDHEIFMELGKRLGQEEYWGKDIAEDLNYILKPSGISWQELKEKGFLRSPMTYRKYEQNNFHTPTGKVELYSTIFEKWGYDPLPQYREIPESPVSKPELLQKYPYILVTGFRSPSFFHSEHRMVPWLREVQPDPVVEIHPETAAKQGIKNGDWVFIESPRGRVKERAKLTTGINPKVIAAQHGWWFPEIKTPDHGWQESNINILTDNDPAGYDPTMGATNLRVLLCNVYPDDKETR
jgi:anaerobic selenocysteine-containing dehydrogenase